MLLCQTQEFISRIGDMLKVLSTELWLSVKTKNNSLDLKVRPSLVSLTKTVQQVMWEEARLLYYGTEDSKCGSFSNACIPWTSAQL